ncbi:MAG: Membrane protein, 6-pyruvoyl-tetrahydropterin synthase-related domain protein [Candidatus Woesebacteria bacterium GW2011_GWA1_39_11b]|nr:MAG: Membrane protein, 6-pyruvoyl-tetrahydropterin synthase-related domain protein [Candidatus Woesebacteria bacterium GW2011_GWA1_39_11b]
MRYFTFMNEAWALMWFPLIFLASYKLFFADKKSVVTWVVTLTLSWFALFTSHNLMVIVFSPFFAIWCLIWLLYSKNYPRVISLVISGVWSFCLAAFFTLPVIFEKGMVQTDTLIVGYYEYTAHFASIGQLLFSRFWGYGPSVWMTQDDRMSFQVGWIHWILSLVILVLLFVRFVRSRKPTPPMIAVVYLICVGWLAAFIAHPRSTPLWGLVNQLKFVQFPWRFLTIVIFGFSFAAGSIISLLRNKVLGVLLIMLVLLYSWNYFVPEYGKLGPLTDEEKFSDAAWELQQTAGIYDYLPNTAKTAPKAPRGEIVDFIKGEGSILSIVEGTNWAKVKLVVKKDALLRINIMDFPNWRVFLDDNEIVKFIPETEEWGRMYVQIPSGDHVLYAKLYNTPVRIIGNLISLFSWIILISFLYRWQKGFLR